MYQPNGTDTTGSMPRRALPRLVGRFLTACAVTAVVLVGTAAPSFAGISGYSVAGTGGAGLTVRTSPYDANASSVALLGDGTGFVAECAVRGRNISGNSVWHRISSPASGWISDFYTNTPGFNQYLPGEPECSTTPPPTGTREDRAWPGPGRSSARRTPTGTWATPTTSGTAGATTSSGTPTVGPPAVTRPRSCTTTRCTRVA